MHAGAAAAGEDGRDARTLLEYDDKLPVSGPALANFNTKLILKAFELPVTGVGSASREAATGGRGGRRAAGGKNASDSGKALEVRSALNLILPPRTGCSTSGARRSNQRNKGAGGQNKSDGGAGAERWVQYVSAHQSSREAIKALEAKLQQSLAAQQARSGGVCPVKEELFSECFDELLRQVTVDCPERGLLLMRLRDELRMTLAAYGTIYESSTFFGGRKAAESVSSTEAMQAEAAALEAQVAALKIQRQEWRNRETKLKQVAEADEVQRAARMQQEKEDMEKQINSFQTFLAQE